MKKGTPTLFAKSVIVQKIDKKIVILDPDRSKLHTLNTSGTFIVEHLQKGLTPEAIAGILTRKFKVPLTRALSDITTFLSEMRKEHLIVS